MSLSIVINTKNAVSENTEHDFKDTLESVRFADEIVIVDMHSTDATREVAKKYTNKIHLFDDVGFVEPARNFAIEKTTGDWILIVDADEVIGEALQKKIKNLITGDATADAYKLPRKNIVFNDWYRYAGWWPDYQLRLFKKGTVTWPETIHAQPQVNGKIDSLAPREDLAINHYNYQTVEQFITRLNRYTTYEARQRDAQAITGAQLVSAFDAELMSRLFLRRGVDAGVHGVGISFLQSFYEVVVQLKQWQDRGFPKAKNNQDTLRALEKLQYNLNYWLADWHARNTTGWHKVLWRLRRKLGV